MNVFWRWLAGLYPVEPCKPPLSIAPAHTYGVFALPAYHHDPFDRLLIAQAQIESLTIVTTDQAFARYDVKHIAA